MMTDRTSKVKVTIIRPHSAWTRNDWYELLEYRDLFLFLIWRNIKTRYAQSVLGIGWAVVQPVATMLVFTVIFGRLVGVESDGVPYSIFAYAALVPWTYFAGAVTEGSSALSSHAGMISKIYFPRLLLPMALLGARLVDFAIALLILGLLMAVYGIKPTTGILMLPVLAGIMTLAAAGLGLWLTALSIQYRDVKHGIGFGVQLLMYASPVVYSARLIPEPYQLLYSVNPMVGVIEGFRAALLATRLMPWDSIAIGGATAAVLFFTGILYFQRRERVFADVA